MADFKDKISNLINSQVPDFVLEDHPLFLDFVKAYYQLMESAEITLTNIGDPDHLVLEGTTAAKIVLDGTNVSKDDGDDNVLLEDTSYGDFINGETITGSTSGATTTVIIEDVDGGGRLFVAHQNKFVEGELITGSSSGAEATIGKYRANPVQNIQQLLDYADVDKTISGFLSKFRNSFLTSVPDKLYEDIDKRNLTKNIKSLYQSKGTKRASEIFFKLLLNEDAEIRYPKDEMLRVSDGKWDTKKIIRCLALGTSEPTNLIGQTITQANNPVSATVNKATAIVEDVFKFLIGGVEVTELVVGDTSVSGTFVAGSTITGTDNTDAATAEGNHDAADDCTVCASSKYSVAGSACVDCPVGTSMAAHASDGVAYDGSNAGEHDSIIDCLICAAHSYQDTAGSASCDSCAAGKDLVNVYGGQSCDEENVGSCADGTYTTKTACETAGETWTAACDATNGAPDSDEAADCTDCSAGKYGPGNFVECADCVLSNTATFGTDTGLTRNDDCAAATCDTGYVLSGDTPDRCNTCDTGYSVSGTACQCAIDYHVQSNQCVACATGTYKNAGDVFSGEDTECNSGGNTANRDAVPDAQGIEALEPDSEYMQKVVYSLGGSLHRNKYGYLVDNNGLLLIGEGKSSDQNAQHHLHVPSRYNEVYFDGNGKIWVVELNGAVYTNIGTITLARFEDPKGLNKYKSIKSRCIAEDNEFGFMLGSWCRHTWLDGLEIDYMDASLVSGPGIIGKPMDQGLGRIINGKKHEITSFLRGQFYKNKAPGWSIKIDGRGYFQFRYIVKKLTSADIRYDQGGTGDGTYNAAYLTGSTRI